ncbi:MAG TPA: hypothetical protein VIQ54_24075 [Polyangia bacterium]|jgi:hypothetical protein
MGFNMEVMLLAGDHRANLDPALRPFGWRTTGRVWPQAEWDAIPKGDHRQGLLGVNCGRNWTVVHDTQVCFVDEYSATPEVARAINADVIIASIADTAGMETFSYATPAGLRRQVHYAEGELESDEGDPLFVVPPEDEDDPRPFPEADVERMLSHVLGFQHDEIVLPDDRETVQIVEIERLPD